MELVFGCHVYKEGAGFPQLHGHMVGAPGLYAQKDAVIGPLCPLHGQQEIGVGQWALGKGILVAGLYHLPRLAIGQWPETDIVQVGVTDQQDEAGIAGGQGHAIPEHILLIPEIWRLAWQCLPVFPGQGLFRGEARFAMGQAEVVDRTQADLAWHICQRCGHGQGQSSEKKGQYRRSKHRNPVLLSFFCGGDGYRRVSSQMTGYSSVMLAPNVSGQ